MPPAAIEGVIFGALERDWPKDRRGRERPGRREAAHAATLDVQDFLLEGYESGQRLARTIAQINALRDRVAP